MSWKDIVRKVAPTLGTALGGPLAGTAVKFIADQVLGRPEASEDEVAEFVLSASPDKLVELKRIDADFKVRMKEIGVDVFKLEVEDRKSARDLAKVDMRPQIVLSALFITGYFAILGVVLFYLQGADLSEGIKTLAVALIGVITGEVPRIMSFWFGSSLGSKEKTVALGRRG